MSRSAPTSLHSSAVHTHSDIDSSAFSLTRPPAPQQELLFGLVFGAAKQVCLAIRCKFRSTVALVIRLWHYAELSAVV